MNILLETKNIDLIKEVGMIPTYLHRIFNFNGKILTYNRGEYPYLEEFCNGVKLAFIKRSKRFKCVNQIFERNVLKFIIKNAKNIDILHLTFLSLFANVIYGIFFKLLNKKGFIYLKADADESIKKFDLYRSHLYLKKRFKFYYVYIHLKKILIKIFINIVDLISFESKELVNFSLKKYPKLKHKIVYIPNGIDNSFIKRAGIKKIPFAEKENIILTVGRIGTYEKATEVILKAISKIEAIKNWKVYLVGSIENRFKEFIKKYFEKYPHLKERIIFTGHITNRRELFNYYQRSKIFCLTSRSESFGIVLVEAAYFGNYIVSSNLPSSRDITMNGTLGSLFNTGDFNELAEILQELINNERILEENYPKVIKHVENSFVYNKIVRNLYREILKRKKS